jgi:hypothetical protein
MPQNAFQVLSQFPGGVFSKLDVTAATGAGLAGLKTGKGTLMRVIIGTAGSAGALTFNDLAVNTGAGAANQIVSLAYNNTLIAAAGDVYVAEFPFQNGLVISAWPTGMVASISWI